MFDNTRPSFIGQVLIVQPAKWPAVEWAGKNQNHGQIAHEGE